MAGEDVLISPRALESYSIDEFLNTFSDDDLDALFSEFNGDSHFNFAHGTDDETHSLSQLRTSSDSAVAPKKRSLLNSLGSGIDESTMNDIDHDVTSPPIDASTAMAATDANATAATTTATTTATTVTMAANPSRMSIVSTSDVSNTSSPVLNVSVQSKVTRQSLPKSKLHKNTMNIASAIALWQSEFVVSFCVAESDE